MIACKNGSFFPGMNGKCGGQRNVIRIFIHCGKNAESTLQFFGLRAWMQRILSPRLHCPDANAVIVNSATRVLMSLFHRPDNWAREFGHAWIRKWMHFYFWWEWTQVRASERSMDSFYGSIDWCTEHRNASLDLSLSQGGRCSFREEVGKHCRRSQMRNLISEY